MSAEREALARVICDARQRTIHCNREVPAGVVDATDEEIASAVLGAGYRAPVQGTTNVEELRKLAEAATPGPWHLRGSVEYGAFVADGGVDAYPDEGTIMRVCDASPDSENPEADEAFIAAANPQTILTLLAELASLRERLRKAQALYDDKARAFVAIDMLHDTDLCISLAELRAALFEETQTVAPTVLRDAPHGHGEVRA